MKVIWKETRLHASIMHYRNNQLPFPLCTWRYVNSLMTANRMQTKLHRPILCTFKIKLHSHYFYTYMYTHDSHFCIQ
ncbi:hypothetical protein PUN28_018349 [Cardiocondyla obscurior]|uniref:Uncharacterized protein n=1 Tax=Cardiocondyla obscurior TaxID=286306 RepID=A0AAW2EGZ2_9HYME